MAEILKQGLGLQFKAVPTRRQCWDPGVLRLALGPGRVTIEGTGPEDLVEKVEAKLGGKGSSSSVTLLTKEIIREKWGVWARRSCWASGTVASPDQPLQEPAPSWDERDKQPLCHYFQRRGGPKVCSCSHLLPGQWDRKEPPFSSSLLGPFSMDFYTNWAPIPS